MRPMATFVSGPTVLRSIGQPWMRWQVAYSRDLDKRVVPASDVADIGSFEFGSRLAP